MSVRTQQLELAAASAPIFLPTFQGPVVVPSGQTYARTYPVIVAGNGPFPSYPPKNNDNDDEQLLYTYGTFREEPIAALWGNSRIDSTWALCVAVPIPDIKNPTLLGLDYMIQYATTCDIGNSTIQTDTILTAKTLPKDVVTQTTDLAVYRSKTGYGPRMIDHKAALRLSTTLAIKCNGGSDQWSHYVDTQQIAPNVRVADKCHLYVVFHVSEYPTLRTVRSLSIEVSATWQKEEVEKNARKEAERKAKAEADKRAQEDAERRAREGEERQARKEEKEARKEERGAREEERRARGEERQAREEEEEAREEEKVARETEEGVRAEEKKARDEEKRAREEEKKARDEEKKARDEEKKARDEEKIAREEEKTAREEEKTARDEEKAAREEEKKARDEEKTRRDEKKARDAPSPSSPGSPAKYPTRR